MFLEGPIHNLVPRSGSLQNKNIPSISPRSDSESEPSTTWLQDILYSINNIYNIYKDLYKLINLKDSIIWRDWKLRRA